MAVDFGPLNEAVLAAFGDETVLFLPAPGTGEAQQTITAIRVDPRSLPQDVPGGAIMVLFVSRESGLTRSPTRHDSFEIDGFTYLVIGEPHADEGGGFYIALTQ